MAVCLARNATPLRTQTVDRSRSRSAKCGAWAFAACWFTATAVVTLLSTPPAGAMKCDCLISSRSSSVRGAVAAAPTSGRTSIEAIQSLRSTATEMRGSSNGPSVWRRLGPLGCSATRGGLRVGAQHQSGRLPVVPKRKGCGLCENRPTAKRAFGRWAVPGGCRNTWSVAPQTEISILLAGESFLSPPRRPKRRRSAYKYTQKEQSEVVFLATCSWQENYGQYPTMQRRVPASVRRLTEARAAMCAPQGNQQDGRVSNSQQD
jgi:hypothetical protein